METTTRSPSAVAVLLNRNAKRVSDDVVRALDGLSGVSLFVSRDFDEARDITARVVRDGYRTVLVGGGDGTFVSWASDITRLAESSGRPVPCFGVLPLGTGNALATTLGAVNAPFSTVAPWALRNELRRTVDSAVERPLPLLDVEGRLTPFAGFGLDALILEDHDAVERMFRTVGVRASAGASYALSVCLRSIPRVALSEPFEVTAINAGEPALALGADGEPLGAPIASGDVLFSGRALIASCATIPFVGLAFRLYPFAQRYPGRFQLRVSEAGVAEMLGHLPRIWRGEYTSDAIHDFACTRVELRVARPWPLQVGGDCAGRRESVVINLARRPLRILA